MTGTRLLYLIIFLQGYVVLACELIAIRELVPFVGSGTDIVAIVISGVLLPLAAGYRSATMPFEQRVGWGWSRCKAVPSIHAALVTNATVAMGFLALGLSYGVQECFFTLLNRAGVTARAALAAAYAITFLATPMYLLAQTLPLVSSFFAGWALRESTGTILACSTAGALAGSLLSTVLLMDTVGVHNSVLVTLGLLGVLAVAASRLAPSGSPSGSPLACLCLFGLAVALNNTGTMRWLHIASDDAYNTIKVRSAGGLTVFDINHGEASLLDANGNAAADYVRYIEANILQPLRGSGRPVARVLVIGAGGFTMGLTDATNDYTFVDIDPALKSVAEDRFLHRRLGPNKRFVASSARAFVRNDTNFYDIIVIDVGTNLYTVPMECTTAEFLRGVKRRLRPGGVLVVNVVADPAFRDRYSVRYDRTFSEVFPAHIRQVMHPFDPWAPSDADGIDNVLYIYFNNGLSDDDTIYTDDKDSYFRDAP